MAGKSKQSKSNKQDSEDEKKKRKTAWLPFVLLLIILIIMILSFFGCIKLPNLNVDSGYAKLYPQATYGVQYAVNLSSDLISLLNETNPYGNSPYSFYLKSGSLPEGLSLTDKGILKGIPTGSGSNFEACIKNSQDISGCRKYHLEVLNNNNNVNPGPGLCPITSCDTGECCCTAQNGVGVSGVLTYASCDCPNDTGFAQWDNITAGGPYKICTCNACE